MTGKALARPSGTSVTDLMASKTVPALFGGSISQEDWEAMPDEEKRAAIDFFRAEQAGTTEGLKITFPRVKYPTSGSGVFEIPGAVKPEYVPTIEGVVVSKQVVRAFWPPDAPIANNPPTCSSPDGIKPVEGPGKQAPLCEHCQWAQFGTSGKEGSAGQACKQRVNVFLRRDINGTLEEIPTLLSFPPTAIKPLSDFAVQVRKSGLNFLSRVTEIGLKDATNRGGTTYKAVTLKLGRPLTYAEMKESRIIADGFRDQMESRGFVPDDEESEAKSEGVAPGTVQNGAHPQVIDVGASDAESAPPRTEAGRF